ILMILLISFLTVALPFLLVKNFSKHVSPINSQTKKLSVYVHDEDKVVEMSVNQYLREVVAAEMPAEFNVEALRAQAIAARTYLVNRINYYESAGTPAEHKGAYTCTDATHCKAWISEKKRKELWGKEKSNEYWKKISDAVDSTGNLIITYNNEPISAVFHSTSSGYTESAKDVWGGDAQYLKSVRSEGEEKSPKYNSQKIYTREEFNKIATEKIPGVTFANYTFGNITRSEAGGILTIDIGGVNVKGTDFRFIFDLQSTNVAIQESDDEIVFNVVGYGHGVGMSQYGANHLASEGKNYEDILKTYYSGVSISEWEGSFK
ncbi:MAG: stage II sporulation protein D, partial [Clostridia bacterium]|nr:stage II sporulation protein D [Clostridia bacterium]